MINNRKPAALLLLTLIVWFTCACSVGVLVNIKAQEITHPVSHTDNFYTADGELVTRSGYEVLKPFSFTFTKWGVSSVLEIQAESDISDELNELCDNNNGDAIVDLTFSVSDPPINGLTFFTKVVTLWGTIIFIPLTIAEPGAENAIIAASSLIIYLLTPAAADISVEGKIVKINRQ